MLNSFLKSAQLIQSRSSENSRSGHQISQPSFDWFSKSSAPAQPSVDAQLWNDLGRNLQAQSPATQMPQEQRLAMALGECAWDSRTQAKGQVLQAMARNRLIALLDSRDMQAHIRADVYPGDIDELATSFVPPQRVFIPPQFISIPIWDLVWQYGYHDPKAWRQLPPEIADAPLKLRRLPLVSASVMPSAAMQVVQELIQSEARFSQLVLFCRLEASQVMRSVIALYLTRSIEIVGFKPSVTAS